MSRRSSSSIFDRGIDGEIAERARSKRYFDLYEERPDYEPVLDGRGTKPSTTRYALSPAALQLAARQVGPSFTYCLYVAPARLLQARNIVWQIVAHTKTNPFAPYVNIIECPALDDGEWVLEANDKRVGSSVL